MTFVADVSVRSLNYLNTNYRGGNGEHGRSSFHAGKGGANIVVKVMDNYYDCIERHTIHFC